MIWLGFRDEELDPRSEIKKERVGMFSETFPHLHLSNTRLVRIKIVRSTVVNADKCVSRPAIMCCKVARKYIHVYLRYPEWNDRGVNVWLQYTFL